MSDAHSNRTRSELDAKIEAFLSQGGEIQEVPVGKTAPKSDARNSQWSKAQTKKPES